MCIVVSWRIDMQFVLPNLAIVWVPDLEDCLTLRGLDLVILNDRWCAGVTDSTMGVNIGQGYASELTPVQIEWAGMAYMLLNCIHVKPRCWGRCCLILSNLISPGFYTLSYCLATMICDSLILQCLQTISCF